MAVSAAKAYIDSVLAVLGDGETHSIADLQRAAAERLQRSLDDRRDPVPSGKRTWHRDQVSLAVAYLFNAGLLEQSRDGLIRITSHGRAVLASADRPIGPTALEPTDKDKPSTPDKVVDPDTPSSPVLPPPQAKQPLVPPPPQPPTAAPPTATPPTRRNEQHGSENHGSNRKRRQIRILLSWTNSIKTGL
jgi:hypothetical protein